MPGKRRLSGFDILWTFPTVLFLKTLLWGYGRANEGPNLPTVKQRLPGGFHLW